MDKKYSILYKDLLDKINKQFYKAGELLPSENELMKIYGVSRHTVRKSLDMLTQDGYIQKNKGKGSFVLDINKFAFPVSGLTSFKEVAKKLNQDFKTNVEELSYVPIEMTIFKKFDINTDTEVYKILRTRELDGSKIILDKDYILPNIVPNITKDICENSIYEYIEEKLKLKISYAEKEITVQKCTDEDRKYLDIEGYDTIVVVKSFVYLEDTRIFQYTESRHRIDKFVFVDFARRIKT